MAHGFGGLGLQGRAGQPVGAGLAFIAPEGAEAAAQHADVAAVEIAVDHIGHRVSHQPPAQLIGAGTQQFEVIAAVAALQQGQRQSGGRTTGLLDQHGIGWRAARWRYRCADASFPTGLAALGGLRRTGAIVLGRQQGAMAGGDGCKQLSQAELPPGD